MNRHRQYGTLDDQPELLGDAAFLRLDMRTDPATLPPGSVQVSQNFRFATLGAQVRAGIARQLPPGVSLAPLRLAGIYRPDGLGDRHAYLTETTLHLFDPATGLLASHGFPTGETIAEGDPVDVIQGGVSTGTLRYLYILRGLSKTVLAFDGASVAVDSNFLPANFGLFYGDRYGAATGAQEFSASDYLDPATWQATCKFQILKGGDDELVACLPYQIGTNNVVVLGTRKRFLVAYYSPELGTAGYSASSFLRGLTREAGPIGRRALIEAAGLLWFITDNGVYAFQPRLDLELTVLGEPLSQEIQPIIDRLSANYASGAAITRHKDRLYFALPINAEPIALTTATLTHTDAAPLELPFDLPASLGDTWSATLTTATAHDLAEGNLVQIAGAMDPYLNGTFQVLAIPTATTLIIELTSATSGTLGARATLQAIATRNNCVAVYNLALQGNREVPGAWESIDVFPAGLHPDWLLVSDFGATRRLFFVDRDQGPCLYEQGDTDEIGSISGGLTLPFDLPAELSDANYGSTAVQGRLVSRSLRVGPSPRQVRAVESRLTLGAEDVGSLTARVRTPDRGTWTLDKAFDFETPDTGCRFRCGKRGLEAELEILTTAGRPTVRSLGVELTEAGRVAEE